MTNRIATKPTADAGDSSKMPNPKLVIILSGKRKSGKDYVSSLLTDYIASLGHGNRLAILRIAAPIKKEFANGNKLEFSRLLDSSEYKEKFRRAMVDWSEKYRAENGWNCFLEQTILEQQGREKSIWILNDARRPCDVEYFNHCSFTSSGAKILKLRIESSDEMRSSRGWQFVEGIDDRDTECGLDGYDGWTLVINNHTNDRASLTKELRPVFEAASEALALMGAIPVVS